MLLQRSYSLSDYKLPINYYDWLTDWSDHDDDTEEETITATERKLVLTILIAERGRLLWPGWAVGHMYIVQTLALLSSYYLHHRQTPSVSVVGRKNRMEFQVIHMKWADSLLGGFDIKLRLKTWNSYLIRFTSCWITILLMLNLNCHVALLDLYFTSDWLIY